MSTILTLSLLFIFLIVLFPYRFNNCCPKLYFILASFCIIFASTAKNPSSRFLFIKLRKEQKQEFSCFCSLLIPSDCRLYILNIHYTCTYRITYHIQYTLHYCCTCMYNISNIFFHRMCKLHIRIMNTSDIGCQFFY